MMENISDSVCLPSGFSLSNRIRHGYLMSSLSEVGFSASLVLSRDVCFLPCVCQAACFSLPSCLTLSTSFSSLGSADASR